MHVYYSVHCKTKGQEGMSQMPFSSWIVVKSENSRSDSSIVFLGKRVFEHLRILNSTGIFCQPHLK